MTLRYAYNTNGCANHRLADAIALIADAGYSGVALTLDIHHLDPFAPDHERQAERLGAELARRGLGLVIETGARFLLDPRLKHEPTLVHPEPEARARRIDFLQRAIRICRICGGEVVSFWAGVPRPEIRHDAAWDWLRDGVLKVVDTAREQGVDVALEPEPGMLVETVDDFTALAAELGEAAPRLALDTGHRDHEIVQVVDHDRMKFDRQIGLAGPFGQEDELFAHRARGDRDQKGGEKRDDGPQALARG